MISLWYVPLIWADFLFALTLYNRNVFTMPEGKRARVLACSSIAIRISSAHPYTTLCRLVDVLLSYRIFRSTFNTRGTSPCMKSCPTVPLKPPAALYNHSARMPTMTQIPRMNSVSPFLPAILLKMAPAVGPLPPGSYQTINLPPSLQCNMSRDRLTVSSLSHRTLDMSTCLWCHE
jgi:hypothetical protein